jgi:putative DNA primase/helicase
MTICEKFQDVISRFEVVTDDDNQFQIRCPAHDDQSPSMVIKVSDDGEKLLVHCRAGCSVDAICEAAGVKKSDLFNSSLKTSGQKPTIRERYPYCDDDGNVLYEVLRMDPKTFRQRHQVDGEWVWNMKGVRRVLFNSPLLKDKPDWPVLVVEGEKDCLRVVASGLPVVPVTCSGGAGKWRDEYSARLAGRRVAIIPDNDEKGQQHARDVVGSLIMWGVESVRVVYLPVKHGGDVSDYLAEHGPDGLISELKSAQEWRPING